MTPVTSGALLGLIAGLGLSMVVVRLPVLRRPRLEDRLGPYLRDTNRPSRLLTSRRSVTPFPALEHILEPFVADASRALERTFGGSASVRRRLEQVGRGTTLEQFRAEQVFWGAAGLLAGLITALLLSAHGSFHAVALLAFCVICAITGVLARDLWLSREVTRREQRIMAEFPTIAELLALAVAAGEGAVGALERVTRISRGELSRELGRALADAHAGASLAQALEGIANRANLSALARFVDGVAIAVERGTPLAEVLRAQAVDVREAGKRALLEAGGRKEIAMMVPVVFLVLPVTVLFALFPGFYGFSFSG
ncbi:MAG: tight adherence protein [Actinomycetota bacterium]|jgi:tight adherence protein C|nr:tight adherence protein [Actinomycetota bacterium]